MKCMYLITAESHSHNYWDASFICFCSTWIIMYGVYPSFNVLLAASANDSTFEHVHLYWIWLECAVCVQGEQLSGQRVQRLRKLSLPALLEKRQQNQLNPCRHLQMIVNFFSSSISSVTCSFLISLSRSLDLERFACNSSTTYSFALCFHVYYCMINMTKCSKEWNIKRIFVWY